jgi:hypothetical protein
MAVAQALDRAGELGATGWADAERFSAASHLAQLDEVYAL